MSLWHGVFRPQSKRSKGFHSIKTAEKHCSILTCKENREATTDVTNLQRGAPVDTELHEDFVGESKNVIHLSPDGQLHLGRSRICRSTTHPHSSIKYYYYYYCYYYYYYYYFILPSVV